jgi:hypothetical protein
MYAKRESYTPSRRKTGARNRAPSASSLCRDTRLDSSAAIPRCQARRAIFY